jgi:hypothetical protein
MLTAPPAQQLVVRLEDYSRAIPAGRVTFRQRGRDVVVHVRLTIRLVSGPVHYRLYRRHTAHTVLSCETFYDHVGTSFDPADPTPADAELPRDRDLGGPTAVLRGTTIARLRARDGVLAVWTPRDVVCGDL